MKLKPGDRVRYCDDLSEDYYVVNVTPGGGTVIASPATSRMNPECFEFVERPAFLTSKQIYALGVLLQNMPLAKYGTTEENAASEEIDALLGKLKS